MRLPLNKFTALAVLWFFAGIYSLLFRESGNIAPPFPHFDKFAHFCLFLAQFWLLAKAFIAEKQPVPYFSLWLGALIYALGSEWAQAAFTHTREGSLLDGVADMCGASLALWLAKQVEAAKLK